MGEAPNAAQLPQAWFGAQPSSQDWLARARLCQVVGLDIHGERDVVQRIKCRQAQQNLLPRAYYCVSCDPPDTKD